MTTKITKWILGKTFFATLIFTALSAGAFAQTHPALGGGTGVSGDPYQIKTPAHLKQLADFVNAGTANGYATEGVYYIVINDLDLTAYAAGEGWNPIGYYTSWTDYSYFKGNFNGNNKKVTNLKINRPTKNYQGLFGYANGAVIENLGVENCDIVGQDEVGGLMGGNDFSTISISSCYVTGNVSGNWFVGGLVGDNFASVTNCYATGNVSGISGSWYVGGLVGCNNAYSTVSNCYATGNVSGGNYVGGLVGDNRSTVSNSYTTGNVSGSWCVGGLVGDNHNGTTVKNCVAANDGVVSTANITNINRICGYTDGIFQNNYALSTMKVINNGMDITATITDGLNTTAGMGKLITDLKTLAFYTTAGNWADSAWDINDPSGVWKICDGESLPFLRWQGISCSGTEVVNITATAGIRIYPNPVRDELRIENGEWRIEKVEILDLTGKIILNSQLSILHSVNVSALPQGIYIVKLKTDKGIVTEKFIKE